MEWVAAVGRTISRGTWVPVVSMSRKSSSSFCFFTHTPPVRPTGDTERARLGSEPVVSSASTGDEAMGGAGAEARVGLEYESEEPAGAGFEGDSCG